MINKTHKLTLFIAIRLCWAFYFLAEVNAEEPVLENRIDISYENKNLSEILKDLANSFDVDIVLTDTATKEITCDVKDVNIEEALSLILCGTPFDFTRAKHSKPTYVVFKTENNNCRIDRETQIFQLNNIEAAQLKDLLPDELKNKVRIAEEQNSIVAEASYNDLKQIKELIDKVDKPLKQVELEVKLIEVSRNALKDLRLFRDTGFAIGKIKNGVSIFDFSLDEWFIFNKQLTYLERAGLAQVHAYPKVVSLSGRTAMININEDTNLVLGSAFGQQQLIGVVSTQRLETIMAGTNLNITPLVGRDNLITTKIAIEVSENNGTTIQNGVSIPSRTTRRKIDSEVQVKDGQTVAIGGLVTNNRAVNRTGLPFITNLPVIGDILSNRNSQKNQSELIVLITPRIRDLTSEKEKVTLKEAPPSEIEKRFIVPQNGTTKKKRRTFYPGY